MRATSIRARGRIPAVFGAVLLVAMTLATSVGATHAFLEISIPIETFVDADEGSKTQLASEDVHEGFAGHFCEVAAHAENQSSVHPGNDLVVESGTSMVVLPDVEAVSGHVVEATETLELGDVITVSLLMGEDEIFSAGIDVIVECFEEETTTTTSEVLPTEATTTTAEVSPTEVTTTTLAATTTTTAIIDTEVTTPEASPSTSIPDEVLGTEVLPFTGIDGPGFGLVGFALLACGLLLMAGARRVDD